MLFIHVKIWDLHTEGQEIYFSFFDLYHVKNLQQYFFCDNDNSFYLNRYVVYIFLYSNSFAFEKIPNYVHT